MVGAGAAVGGDHVEDLARLAPRHERVDEPGLTIPHARLTERAFALVPLYEVLPDAWIDGRPLGDSVAERDLTGMQRLAPPGWHRQ